MKKLSKTKKILAAIMAAAMAVSAVAIAPLLTSAEWDTAEEGVDAVKAINWSNEKIPTSVANTQIARTTYVKDLISAGSPGGNWKAVVTQMGYATEPVAETWNTDGKDGRMNFSVHMNNNTTSDNDVPAGNYSIAIAYEPFIPVTNITGVPAVIDVSEGPINLRDTAVITPDNATVGTDAPIYFYINTGSELTAEEAGLQSPSTINPTKKGRLAMYAIIYQAKKNMVHRQNFNITVTDVNQDKIDAANDAIDRAAARIADMDYNGKFVCSASDISSTDKNDMVKQILERDPTLLSLKDDEGVNFAVSADGGSSDPVTGGAHGIYGFKVTITNTLTGTKTEITPRYEMEIIPADKKYIIAIYPTGSPTSVETGTGGDVKFKVTTQSIDNGKEINVTGLVNGMTAATTAALSSNEAEITITVNDSVPADLYTLTAEIDGETRKFSVLVKPIPPNPITVIPSSSNIIEGVGGTATYAVLTTGITGSPSFAIGSSTIIGTVTASGSITGPGTGTLVMTLNETAVAGTYTFTITINGVESEDITLTVDPVKQPRPDPIPRDPEPKHNQNNETLGGGVATSGGSGGGGGEPNPLVNNSATAPITDPALAAAIVTHANRGTIHLAPSLGAPANVLSALALKDKNVNVDINYGNYSVRINGANVPSQNGLKDLDFKGGLTANVPAGAAAMFPNSRVVGFKFAQDGNFGSVSSVTLTVKLAADQNVKVYAVNSDGNLVRVPARAIPVLGVVQVAIGDFSDLVFVV